MPENHTPTALLWTLILVLACGPCWNPARAAEPHPEWTLFTPVSLSPDTYLLDLNGNIVHTWPSSYTAGASVYLLDDGAILRTCNDPNVGPSFTGGGRGGRLQRIAWDGTVKWSYPVGGEDFCQHHDVEVLPNGNILAIVWERYTHEDAVAAGRDPAGTGTWLWSEAILEIEPSDPNGGTVVWSWHAWDWLVQNFDANKPNYGNPADYPGRIDINFEATTNPNWLHINAVDYHAQLDQIVLSPRRFSEIWIISHAPGDSGELLYRWGNPQAYGRGTADDQQFFRQHDPQWIPPGLPGAENLTVFNNGMFRGYASIDELEPPLNPDGTYHLEPNSPFGPESLTWTCDTIDGEQFSAMVMSSVQRLANGNNLICLAQGGEFIEVDNTCSKVWDHLHYTGAEPGLVFRATRIDAHDPRLAGLLYCSCDLPTFAAQWLRTDCQPFDHCGGVDCNWDGKVNLLDFIYLADPWPCQPF